MSILSGHCSRWLTRDNHVYSRVVILGVHVGLALLWVEACCAGVMLSDQVLTFPSKHFWSRRRFLNVWQYFKQTSKTRLAFTGLLRAALLTENASLSDVFWFGRIAAFLMGCSSCNLQHILGTACVGEKQQWTSHLIFLFILPVTCHYSARMFLFMSTRC